MHFLSTFLFSLAAISPTSYAIPTTLQQTENGVSLEARQRDHIVLGQYDIRLKEELGRGQFAKVYAAHMTPNREGLDIAVKVSQKSKYLDIVEPGNWIRELVRDFSHIAKVVIGGTVGSSEYLVMERTRSNVENDIRAGRYNGDNARIKSHFGGVLDGLAEFHKRGLSHNDVHTQNVGFIGQNPKLIDFDFVMKGQYHSAICTRNDIKGPGK
jgi:serine/threonine protein kinase